MRVATVILHAARSTERSANVYSLLGAIPGARVLVDEDGSGEARIGVKRGCWPSARRAWSLPALDDETHRLVLEDDAHLCDRFVELAREAIERAPHAAISYFRGARGCSVATSIPVALLPEWLAWAEIEATRTPHHDLMIAMGMRELARDHFYTRPSLVEHGPLPSLLGHGELRADYFERSATSFSLER